MRSYPNRVESFSPGHRPAGRPKGWLTSVVTKTRIAGCICVVLGFVVLGYFALVTGVFPKFAGEDRLTWVVTQASGDVRYRSGGNSPTKWQELRVGDVVGAAAEIRTGRKSRVVLGHRQTTMTATAESRVALPGGSGSNGAYRVLQSLGTLLYTIKERADGMAAFEVETPFLVALVKGTVFTVNASAEEASVELSEGVVRVQPTRGGKGATLTAGQTARVTRASDTDVIIKGRGADRRSSVKPQAPTRLAMANTQRTGPAAGGGNAITGSRKDPGTGRASTGTETLAKKMRVLADRQVAALSEATRGGGDPGGDNPGGDGPRGGGTGASNANTGNPGGGTGDGGQAPGASPEGGNSVKPQAPTRLAMANTQRTGPAAGGGTAITGSRKDPGTGRASTDTETLAKKMRVLADRQVAALSEATRGGGDPGGDNPGGDGPRGGGTGASSANTGNPGGGTGDGGQAPGASPEGGNPGGGGTSGGTDVGGSVGGGEPGGGDVARSDWSQDTARGANTGRGTLGRGKVGRGKTATGSPMTIWSAPSMVMEAAEDWMDDIWEGITEGMETWVGAVWLLSIWAVLWVAVSTLRVSIARTKKRPC